MIQSERMRRLNDKPARDGAFILYWMQAAQRADWNHALEYAVRTTNQRQKPLFAVFVLTDYPEANLRHYYFMLEGLKETQVLFAKRGITLLFFIGRPEDIIPPIASKADAVITDDGYLRNQRQWRKDIAAAVECSMTEVITNVIVPVEAASDKENFSAGTLRPRIHKRLKAFLEPLKHSKLYSRLRGNDTVNRNDTLCGKDVFKGSIAINDIDSVLKKMKIDSSVKPSPVFAGGPVQAQKRLKLFIADKLDQYAENRNDPALDIQSHLSPYLHFGQISPLQAALEIARTASPGQDAFLEELIVRRELGFNYVWYNPGYDKYDALPLWAKNTLNVHAKDKRPYLYSLEQIETARTHDPAWNAAQMEMVVTGKMHNYMRMYWGKKIMEWAKSPKQAFEWALYLNNKYQLDGRDPNSFAGVAWCFGKHDRPWGERSIFGKVRYMNYAGLKRKFNLEYYINKYKIYF